MDEETRKVIEELLSRVRSAEDEIYSNVNNFKARDWRYWATKDAARSLEDAASRLREVLHRD